MADVQRKTKQILITCGVTVAALAALISFRLWRLEQVPQLTDLEVYLTDSAREQSALSDPDFTIAADVDDLLSDLGYGIDVEANGAHRFYPYQFLNWHPVVNDTIDGTHIVVTYDALSGSAVVYERGQRTFTAADQVYNGNLLLADGTGSLWYQVRGEAITGPATGKKLVQYPARSLRWGDWKAYYPSGLVLSTNTGYDFDYRHNPYTLYALESSITFSVSNIDARVSPAKSIINGVIIDNQPIAFIRDRMMEKGTVEMTIGAKTIVAIYNEELAVTDVFLRESDGETLTPVNAPEYYWFAWAAAYPNTYVAE